MLEMCISVASFQEWHQMASELVSLQLFTRFVKTSLNPGHPVLLKILHERSPSTKHVNEKENSITESSFTNNAPPSG
jgi:hypothetical protein